MHRHGYQERKFNRERDERRALIKGLADSLVKYESVETTLPKAKEIVPYVEKLITKAKIGDLHNRRQVIASLHTVSSAHKLIDEIAPRLKGRSSGHLRVEKTKLRRGDNAQMARVSFVDDLKSAPVSKPVESVTAKNEAEPLPKKSTPANKSTNSAVKKPAKTPKTSSAKEKKS